MYRVEWLDAAFDRMGELIRDYPDQKQAFAPALQRLSRDLSQWPEDVGESRPDGRRIGFFGPLVVYYRVLATERVARVISVRLRRPESGA